MPALALPVQVQSGLTSQQSTKVKQGKVIVRLQDTRQSTLKDVLTIGYIDAPAETVWRTITDYPNYPEIYGGVLNSEVKKQEGNTVHHYAMVDYPWPLPDKWTLNAITHDRDRWTVKIHRIDGTIKEMEGGWHLYPEGKRTLVVYSVRFDPGLSFLPKWVIEWGTAQVAPQVVQNIRNYIKNNQK